jgi:hypothetical protein
MSDKPLTTTLPRWADGTAASVVAPTSGKRDVGYVGNERPPAEYLNSKFLAIYNWLKWIDDGYFTRADEADRTPVIALTDADGRVREYVDNAGYRFGPALNFLYYWSPIGEAQTGARTRDEICEPYMELTSEANTRWKIENPAATPAFGGTKLMLQVDDAAVSQSINAHTAGVAVEGEHIISGLDDVICCMEWMAQMTAVGANNVDVHMGLHEDASDQNTAAIFEADVCACFRKQSGDTNWQSVINHSGTPDVDDLGTPPVANTWQTFRIEYHGAATPLGVANSSEGVIRFFIDGSLENEISSTDVPDDNDALGVVFRARADTTGPSGDWQLTLSPVKVSFNTVLTPSVPA